MEPRPRISPAPGRIKEGAEILPQLHLVSTVCQGILRERSIDGRGAHPQYTIPDFPVEAVLYEGFGGALFGSMTLGW